MISMALKETLSRNVKLEQNKLARSVANVKLMPKLDEWKIKLKTKIEKKQKGAEFIKSFQT